MVNFNFESRQATPEWLTSVLTKNGFLSNGEVSSVEQKRVGSASFISNFESLRVTYSPGSSGAKPAKIILKAIKPELVEGEQHRELNFYNLTFDIQTELPLMTCFGTEVCPETNQYCLLLEDLKKTHHQTQFPVPPTQIECEAAIVSLASVHAYWWGHPPLGEKVFIRPSENHLQGFFQHCESVYPKFTDFLKDNLPENRKKIYELIFENLPKLLWERISPYEKQTFTHGDAHFWNFFYPNNGQDHRCVIFDWQSSGVGIPTRDLAYMIAYQWYREMRQQRELPLLKHYHDELMKRQIHYTWEDLLLDYRVLRNCKSS